MDLTVNQLFQWCDEKARIKRVLWIEPSGQHIVTIDVADGRAWPSLVERSLLERHVTQGDIRLLEADIYGYLRQPDSAFPLSHLEQRDKAWRIIEEIVALQEAGEGCADGAIFHSSILGRIVQAAAERTGYSKRWVRTCLRRYWQRGQMKNALLPQTDRHIMGRAEHKSADRHAPKRGRPSLVATYTGIATGVNIDATIKEYSRRGTKLYYEHVDKITLRGAFRHILTLYYHQGKELRNGRFLPILPPAGELPTWNQYRYWYRKQDDLTTSIPSFLGSQALDAGESAAPGYPRQKIFAPSRQFEIHVVIGGLNLVSMLDRRRILGRPVIYIIVDVFSDLVAGMHVSLEGPSQQGALLALENMVHDKVAFCREYGIDVAEAAWPCHHLPQTILAGGCEPLLERADILLKALDIEVSNGQPCRLDWRESLERCFPLSDDTTIHWGSGPVYSHSEPGPESHWLDGCLTLADFRRLVIECIVEHNLAHRLSYDDLSRDMIAAGVEPYPRDVWTWVIQNCSGTLRTLPTNDLRRVLLPHAEATVTPEGIYFHGMLYTCDISIQGQWFDTAHSGAKERWSVPIIYDPRKADCIYLCPPDRIYIRPQGGQPLEICRLLEKDEPKFEGCHWYDIEDLIAHPFRTATITRNYQHQVELRASRDHIVEEVQHGTSEAPGDRAVEQGQEGKTTIRDFPEQKVPGSVRARSDFKGVVERFFALGNIELFQ